MKPIVKWLLLPVVCGAAALAHAQSFPSKPIRIIIPSAAGGGSDVPARIVGSEMERRMGQPMVVDNRPGAGMTIAAKAVALAPPDGYTVYFAGALSPHPLFSKSNPVDARKEFAPVSNLVSFGALFMMVSSKLPVSNFKELLAYSKAHPRKLNYANVTPTQELSMVMLQHKTGLSSTTISYKADPQVATALMSGEADIAMIVGSAYMRYLQDGTFKALFVAAPQRAPVLPNVPTAAEAGVPDFDVAFNAGMWAPAGTPRDIIMKLNAESNASLKTQAVAQKLRAVGSEPLGSTPEELLRSFERDVQFFTEAIKLSPGYEPR